MRLFLLPLVLVVVLVAFPKASSARGLGKLVTKATQKELELEYELSAIREPGAVIISMAIPKDGKLKELRQVRLSILAKNRKNYLILAPLEMRQVDDRIQVSAQLDPELAEKATLELVVQEGRTEFFYSVRISDYISERKNSE